MAMQVLVYDDSHRAASLRDDPTVAALGARARRAGPSQIPGPMHVTRPDKAGRNSAIAMLFLTPSNGKPSAPEDHLPSRLGQRW